MFGLIHEDYDSETKEHDIALLRLPENVSLGRVIPVCTTYYYGREFRTCGMGKMNGYNVTSVLQETDLAETRYLFHSTPPPPNHTF